MANLLLALAFALFVVFALGLLGGWSLGNAVLALIASFAVMILWSIVALSRRGRRRRRPWTEP